MNKRDDSIPDLTDFQYQHVQELAFRTDLSSPLAGTAIGWLGATVPQTGPIPSSVFDALRNASTNCSTDAGELGYHTCQVCKRFEDRGEFVIDTKGRTCVLPRMVIHYIEVHQYRPPQQFLNDLNHWNEDSNNTSEPNR